MKRFAAMLTIVGLVASAGFAGTVEFDPALTEVPIDNIPASIDIQVTLNSDAGTFDSTNVVIGSNDGLTIADFAYTQDFIDGAGTFIQAPTAVGVYPSDLFVGGFVPSTLNTPFLLGTLTVALPAVAGGLTVGDEFSYLVDSTIDGGFSSIGSESLLGSGTITIAPAEIPEPATMALLGLGAVALIRRRRFA